MGDMAVSNAIGSNVFDILLGLSLPWFLKTGVAYAGTTVIILYLKVKRVKNYAYAIETLSIGFNTSV